MDPTITTEIESAVTNFLTAETPALVEKIAPTWFSASTKAAIAASLGGDSTIILGIVADYAAHRVATAAAAAKPAA